MCVCVKQTAEKETEVGGYGGGVLEFNIVEIRGIACRRGAHIYHL